MEPLLLYFGNYTYKNYVTLLINLIDRSSSIINCIKDPLARIRFLEYLNVLNKVINYHKENLYLISTLVAQIDDLNKEIEILKFNSSLIINNQELEYNDGSYKGQIVYGKPKGKGILYYDNGDRYEGDWINGQKEGKGIMYYDNGDRYEGDWINGEKEGKGIMYYDNGDRYEGDYTNNNRERQGIMYYNNGDREMGDFLNDKPIGKFVTLTKKGEVKINNYLINNSHLRTKSI